MIADPDIWRSAKLLVDQHGADATFHAAQRADELMSAGDTEGWEVWRRIARAVDELLRASPKPGERWH